MSLSLTKTSKYMPFKPFLKLFEVFGALSDQRIEVFVGVSSIRLKQLPVGILFNPQGDNVIGGYVGILFKPQANDVIGGYVSGDRSQFQNLSFVPSTVTLRQFQQRILAGRRVIACDGS